MLQELGVQHEILAQVTTVALQRFCSEYALQRPDMKAFVGKISAAQARCLTISQRAL